MDKKESIIELLKQHKGQEDAITVSEILAAIGSYEYGSCPVTRQQIKKAIESHCLPIGSCAQGYFIIETQAELNSYMVNLESRIKGITSRMKAVKRSFYALH